VGQRDPRKAWAEGLAEETAYWRAYFESGGEPWPDDYRRRVDPSSRLQEHIARYIALPKQSHAAILDVGAGPLTSVGKTHPDFRLSIVAVDALGDAYDRLIEEAAVEPPVRTLRCDTERLSEMFGIAAFDVVHARNCIDHSYDPIRAIREMARVAKPGGAVLLQHYANEAEHGEYNGLHGWNLSVTAGRFTVSRPKLPWGTETHDVAAELTDVLQLVSTEADHDESDNMDFVVFRRTPCDAVTVSSRQANVAASTERARADGQQPTAGEHNEEDE
jgi:SAM-dependent methyltransferase